MVFGFLAGKCMYGVGQYFFFFCVCVCRMLIYVVFGVEIRGVWRENFGQCFFFMCVISGNACMISIFWRENVGIG